MATALFQTDFDRADAMLIGPTSALRYVIAECIAQERERCAQIAEDRQGFWRGETIAAEIRGVGAVTQDKRGNET